MLILPLKAAVRFDLSTALAKWLDDSSLQNCFQPMNPLQFVLPKPDFGSAACRQELMRLQSLRNCLTDCLLKADSHKCALEEGALDDCHEYHAILLEFEKRGFPVTDDETTPLALTWKSAFAPQKETHATLVWDRACTVFNTAALWTQKAADCSVADRDDCKRGVGYCQQAASVLAVLRELCQSQPQFATVDLSSSMLTFWEKLLLAQAQSFIYRMASLSDSNSSNNSSSRGDPSKKKHGTLAILSQSAYQLFNDALSATQDPRLQSEVPKQTEIWGAYCKSNSMLAAARADYHQSVVYRVECLWGKEIAQLRDCELKMKGCRDFLQTLRDSEAAATSYTKRECLAILPVVTDRLHEADDDNYRTYHNEIPVTMPEITSKQLAKLNPDLPPTMLVPKKALFAHLS